MEERSVLRRGTDEGQGWPQGLSHQGVPTGVSATEATSHGGSCSSQLCWVGPQAPPRWAAVTSNTHLYLAPFQGSQQIALGRWQSSCPLGVCISDSVTGVRSPHVPRRNRASESGTDQEGSLEGHRAGGEARAGAKRGLPHPPAEAPAPESLHLGLRLCLETGPLHG